MVKVSNNFEEMAKTLLKEVSGRARDVIERRFGIGSKSKRQTLESIGGLYKITRERVRQIEAAAVSKMLSSPSFSLYDPVLSELEHEFNLRENMWREDDILAHFAGSEAEKNHVYFFLSLGKPFERRGADFDFYHRWTNDASNVSDIEKAIKTFCDNLGDEPLKKEEIHVKFKNHAGSVLGRTLGKEAVFAWLGATKKITSNNFGEWGLATSSLVRPSGMRDFAYLVLKRHGSPLHFREVSSSIEEMANKKAHVQTVHNELIKDERFVLVGRGLYALSSWGYQPGTVRDIIKSALKENGPVSKEDLIDIVKRERHVKDNTISINLQNKKHFKELPDGRFHLA